jgi:hypothetical protein
VLVVVPLLEGSGRPVHTGRINDSTRSFRAWESTAYTTQGCYVRHGSRRPCSSSAVVTAPWLLPHDAQHHRRIFFFYYYTKLNGNHVSPLFFSFLFTRAKFTESIACSNCPHACCIPSPGIIVDIIPVTLTIQVHIIPGLEPGILTLPRLVSVVVSP